MCSCALAAWSTAGMELVAVPTPRVTIPSSTSSDHRLPSALEVPSVPDGSAAAAASLDQVASYVGLLSESMVSGPDAYARTIKRGFLESALNYAKYAYAMVDFDQSVNNDGFKGMIEGAVIESLVTAKQMGLPTGAEPDLVNELTMVAAAATNAARALEALVRSAANQ